MCYFITLVVRGAGTVTAVPAARWRHAYRGQRGGRYSCRCRRRAWRWQWTWLWRCGSWVGLLAPVPPPQQGRWGARPDHPINGLSKGSLQCARACLPVGYLGSLRLPFESITPIVRLPVSRLLEAHG